MKIHIWCAGVTYNWRRQAVQTADGMWAIGWLMNAGQYHSQD